MTGFRKLLALLWIVPLGSGAIPAYQEAPGKRLGAIVGVAVEEYGKGIDAKGRLISATELDEATGFLREARDVAARLTSRNAASVRLLLDSLSAAAARHVTPAQLNLLHQKFVVALGAEGALDLPSGLPALARGRSLYELNCAGCHGVRGEGAGPAATGINPPPPPIGTVQAMHDVSPALMYRIISVGVRGTKMDGWGGKLSSDERWAIVTWLNSLRATPADVAAGATLLSRYCKSCNVGKAPARDFAWQAERSDAEMASAITADSGSGIAGGAKLGAGEIAKMVTALRASVVVTSAPQAPAAAAGADSADPRAIARRVTRLVDDALAAARQGRGTDAVDLAFDAYIAFEPLEASARMRRPGLVADMERGFADFKGAVKAGDLAAAEEQRLKLELGMPSILELSGPTSTAWGAFLESFVIILREGFEAILVLGAIVAFLTKTGNRARVRDVWIGGLAGLAASAILAVLLRTVLSAVPASQDIIEGVTMLVAVAVLFSVSYWLLSKVEAARWQRFIRDKVNSALSHGGSVALGGVAFLAVFREGAETALFFQALFANGPGTVVPVTTGILVGFAALIAIFALFYRFGVRIPLRPFFAVTSGLLYYMALVFAGKGLKELQEGGVISRTLIPGFPHVDLIGLYPTAETLLAQGALTALLLFAIWRALRPQAEGLQPESAPAGAIPPEVASRLAELQATATQLRSRVETLEKEIEHESRARDEKR